MKIDCSITENYLKELERSGRTLNMTLEGTAKQEVENMQKWSDANEQKTYLEDLNEKYPDFVKSVDGYPYLCIINLGYKTLRQCDLICSNCWNQIMEENNA